MSVDDDDDDEAYSEAVLSCQKEVFKSRLLKARARKTDRQTER